MCCHIEPMTYGTLKVPYKQNAVDTFTGTNLKECEDFELPQMSYLAIRNYRIRLESLEADHLRPIWPDGWMGNFIEIEFNNQSRIHCDLVDLGLILDKCELRN